MNGKMKIMAAALAPPLLAAVLLFPAAARAESVLVISRDDAANRQVVKGFADAFSGPYRQINLEGSDERQRVVGGELAADKPEVAVVVGDLAVQMAKWRLEDVPVIYCNSMRASKITLTESAAAGVYHEPNPVNQLEYMHNLFPDRKKVGVFYSPRYGSVSIEEVRQAAGDYGLALQTAAVDSIKDIPAALRDIMPGVDLIWVLTDPVVLSSHSIQYIVLQSISARVPVFCGENELAHGGATAALVPDLESAGRLAGKEAAAALSGSSAGQHRIRYPRGRLVLNQKTAALMQVTFPPSLAEKAEVIK